MIPNKEQQTNFSNAAVAYMKAHHQIPETQAQELMDKYIEDIETDKPIVQQLGPDYFAIQILMAEGLIPYRPI